MEPLGAVKTASLGTVITFDPLQLKIVPCRGSTGAEKRASTVLHFLNAPSRDIARMTTAGGHQELREHRVDKRKAGTADHCLRMLLCEYHDHDAVLWLKIEILNEMKTVFLNLGAAGTSDKSLVRVRGRAFPCNLAIDI